MAAGFRSVLLLCLAAAVAAPAAAAVELKAAFAKAERPAGRADKKRMPEPRHRNQELKRLAARAVEQIVVLGELDLVVWDGIGGSHGIDIADLLMELFAGRE